MASAPPDPRINDVVSGAFPLKRIDADLVRWVSAGLGAALGLVWVVALATGATMWLAWITCLAALACFGSVALVPERRSGFLAGGNLALAAGMLGACWIVGLLTCATGWLVWFAFGGAAVVLVGSVAITLAAVFDRLR